VQAISHLLSSMVTPREPDNATFRVAMASISQASISAATGQGSLICEGLLTAHGCSSLGWGTSAIN
jgi:hypothetical protein